MLLQDGVALGHGLMERIVRNIRHQAGQLEFKMVQLYKIGENNEYRFI